MPLIHKTALNEMYNLFANLEVHFRRYEAQVRQDDLNYDKTRNEFVQDLAALLNSLARYREYVRDSLAHCQEEESVLAQAAMDLREIHSQPSSELYHNEFAHQVKTIEEHLLAIQGALDVIAQNEHIFRQSISENDRYPLDEVVEKEWVQKCIITLKGRSEELRDVSRRIAIFLRDAQHHAQREITILQKAADRTAVFAANVKSWM